MKEDIKLLLSELKSNPLTVLGELAYVAGLFGLLYVALWIGCPC